MKHWVMVVNLRQRKDCVVAEFVRARVGQSTRARVYRPTVASLRRLQRAINDAAFVEVALEDGRIEVSLWSF